MVDNCWSSLLAPSSDELHYNFRHCLHMQRMEVTAVVCYATGCIFFSFALVRHYIEMWWKHFLLMPIIRFVSESPRWLLAMGRVEETMEVLQKASKINKHPLPVNMDKILKQVSYKLKLCSNFCFIFFEENSYITIFNLMYMLYYV
jgi:hypothetical protein